MMKQKIVEELSHFIQIQAVLNSWILWKMMLVFYTFSSTNTQFSHSMDTFISSRFLTLHFVVPS